jgi:type II secretory pathway component PulK
LNCRGLWSYRAGDGGSILIVVLWTVFFLGLLSVAVGAYVGARLELARRMNERLHAWSAARSGVEKSLAVLRADTNAWDAVSEPWADNPKDFRDVLCGNGVYSIFQVVERSDGSSVTNYGVCDEQGRIDLNQLDAFRIELLTALLATEGGLIREDAARLSRNIQAAGTLPEPGKIERPGVDTGWISPDIPCGPFRSVQELLWIKGMNREVFRKVRAHVTVGAGSRININTADGAVLRALFSRGEAGKWDVGGVDGLVRKILNFRESGGIFKNPRNLAGDFDSRGELSGEERMQLNGASRFVSVRSDRFRGYVRGGCKGRATSLLSVEFVWNRKQNRIEYWHED